jgi:hypothetical protein
MKVATSSAKTVSADSSTKKARFTFKYKDFEIFYDQFIRDSTFQITHVKFPIKGTYADYTTKDNWHKNTWPLIKWNLFEELESSTDSISIIQKENSFFFGSYCIDCGFSFEMEFRKLNSEWYLVYRQENNY